MVLISKVVSFIQKIKGLLDFNDGYLKNGILLERNIYFTLRWSLRPVGFNGRRSKIIDFQLYLYEYQISVSNDGQFKNDIGTSYKNMISYLSLNSMTTQYVVFTGGQKYLLWSHTDLYINNKIMFSMLVSLKWCPVCQTH